jgi:hypothetical protein
MCNEIPKRSKGREALKVVDCGDMHPLVASHKAKFHRYGNKDTYR